MSDVIVKRLEEIEPYSGAKAIAGIRIRPAGRTLGVSAWGMNVIEIDAGCERYPEHDHVKDGQEEVYVLLRGGATLHAGGNQWTLQPGTLVRVGPGTKRKFVPGQQGVTLLAIGGTPGQAYQARR